MKRSVVVVLIGVVCVLGLLVAGQRRLVYFPSPVGGGVPDGVETVSTTTSDGLELQGWLRRDTPEQPLVLVFHGNGGNREGRVPLARALAERDIAVLLTDYRGYGGNPGSPSEEGLARDAVAWRRWAEEHHDGAVTYVGESLGAAVATALAVEAPPAGLVLRSPFPSLAAVARVHYPIPGLGRLLWDRYDVVGHIRHVGVPTLIVVGTADAIVPTELSREVADARGDARWVAVEGAGHNDRALLDGSALVAAVAEVVGR